MNVVPLSDIQIRDPFVVPVADEEAYYLFGSTDPDIWSGPGIRSARWSRRPSR